MYNTYNTYNVFIIYMLYKHMFAPKGGGGRRLCKAVKESVKYSLSLSPDTLYVLLCTKI